MIIFLKIGEKKSRNIGRSTQGVRGCEVGGQTGLPPFQNYLQILKVNILSKKSNIKHPPLELILIMESLLRILEKT